MKDRIESAAQLICDELIEKMETSTSLLLGLVKTTPNDLTDAVLEKMMAHVLANPEFIWKEHWRACVHRGLHSFYYNIDLDPSFTKEHMQTYVLFLIAAEGGEPLLAEYVKDQRTVNLTAYNMLLFGVYKRYM